VFARAIDRARTAGRLTDGLARTLGFVAEPYIFRSDSAMTKTISHAAKRHHVTDHHRGLRAEGPFEFASTQVNFETDIADKVLALAATIPDDALSDKGREAQPHVTVEYGIDPATQIENIAEVIENSDTVKEMAGRGATMTLGATAVFPGEEYDVVYVTVESPDLIMLNSVIAKGVTTTDTQPEYIPHVTLAYVKPGEGEKYVGDETLVGTSITFDTIAFSDTDGNLTEVPLAGEGTFEEARASRAKIRAILRCCGCGPYDEKPPVISEEAKAAEVPMLRQAAEISLQQVELGMTIWKTAETEQVRNIGNSLLYDGMWRFDRCLYFLNEWYGEDLEVNIPTETVDEAERALKNYRATRAGAVFSKKNLDKIAQIGSLADELLNAATKPGADDVPAEDDRAQRLSRSASRSTSATASGEMKVILDSIITESAEIADDQKATTKACSPTPRRLVVKLPMSQVLNLPSNSVSRVNAQRVPCAHAPGSAAQSNALKETSSISLPSRATSSKHSTPSQTSRPRFRLRSSPRSTLLSMT
jgi:2'-5' RNA ligase